MDMTYYDRMRASTLMGGVVQTLTGQPPLSFKSDGSPLISWSMKGNGQQNGTPSPQNIVPFDGSGERTGNLAQWEKGGINTSTGADEAYRTAAQGGTCEQMRSLYVPCSGNTSYVLHLNHYPVQTFISYYDADKIYISRSSGSPQGEKRIFTTPETARYMRAQLAHVTSDQVYPAIEENQQYAITLGSTALPYEPYGYKIPLTNAGQTVPIYLGEVQTVRRINKLVFDGNEPWVLNGNRIYISNTDTKRMSPLICTHFPNVQNTGMWNGNNWVFQVDISTLGMTGRDAWIAYLRQQYAAGTPVTVWYVLATPTTGIVNEPLAKIGTYADELHSADAGVSIPTVKGQNTLTVDTELQPSEMTIEYRG